MTPIGDKDIKLTLIGNQIFFLKKVQLENYNF